MGMWDEEKVIIGRCSICNRGSDTIRLAPYGFNEPKQLVDWNANPIVSDNPNALEIKICGSDMNLISRIKRESNKLSPKQILDRAVEYRITNPIRE